MTDFEISIFGLILHFAAQLIYGVKSNAYEASTKIMWFFIISFILIGAFLSFTNTSFTPTTNNVRCGTEAFNSILSIGVLGNIFNIPVYMLSFIVVSLLYRIMK